MKGWSVALSPLELLLLSVLMAAASRAACRCCCSWPADTSVTETCLRR